MDTASLHNAMGEALGLAHEAAAACEVPVGAVVLDADGTIIGRGRNRREADGDPLAHAEVVAMREAARRRGDSEHNRQDVNVIRFDDCEQAGNSADLPSADEKQDISMQNAWNLTDCTLVVTLEPCPMCAGAALQTHVGRIVFGAWDVKLGACGSVWDIPRDPHVGARPEVIGGVREGECTQLLTRFFSVRR
ncbi:nucleoside deaminase [Bifidobacterium sp. ESL0784]|uniref:nucleoside deaminase n=1 Tax=Bifidobacterium sp. ESL0784 TaxID=2983231 RepID=UPI0023F6DF93|nr:nucleoside deaminase [Bifidobacterium sp. ESL0784]MDF7640117.1 nucleoside deaminase [Bifidobacterium sp. ESL0784]